MSLANPPALVESSGLRFLIFDAPNDDNLDSYIAEWKKNNVKAVVRVCEPTYDANRVRDEGIDLQDWPFSDGGSPTDELITNWNDLCKDVFKAKDNSTVGVHCVAGLGRAPLLVAIALIEAGMEPLAAVTFIRKKRRGAINAVQLKFLRGYKKKGKKDCVVM